jgi:ATP-dependent DNA helicase RecG
MNSKLPVNLRGLLRQRSVEGERIEYKAGWNPDAIVRTLCAFANDFANFGGGYIVIGQDCDEAGQPISRRLVCAKISLIGFSGSYFSTAT